MSMQDIVNDNIREGEKMLRDMKTATQPMNTSTNQSSIEKILEELYRAGTHKMYCTEPHHFRSIAETERQITALINRDYILKSEILSALAEEYGTDNYKPFLVATKSIPLEKNIHAAKIVLIARNKLRAEIKTKLGLEK